MTSIGSYSFRYCSKLAKVYIYAPSLTTYGYDAFDNNAGGRKIYVPASALDTYKTEWDDYDADIEAMIAANEGETGEYWATYYNSTTSFTADANTTVFQAALVGNHLTLKEVENREIPAGNAVILKSTEATITLKPGETTATTLEGNSLLGVSDAAGLTASPPSAICSPRLLGNDSSTHSVHQIHSYFSEKRLSGWQNPYDKRECNLSEVVIG